MLCLGMLKNLEADIINALEYIQTQTKECAEFIELLDPILKWVIVMIVYCDDGWLWRWLIVMMADFDDGWLWRWLTVMMVDYCDDGW